MPKFVSMNPKTKRSNKTDPVIKRTHENLNKWAEQAAEVERDWSGGNTTARDILKDKGGVNKAIRRQIRELSRNPTQQAIINGVVDKNGRIDEEFLSMQAGESPLVYSDEAKELGIRQGRGRFAKGGKAEQIHERKKAERAAKKAAEEKKKQEESMKKTAARGRSKMLGKLK